MIESYAVTVPQTWLDYNGHLTEGYYGVAFGHASDGVLEAAGFGPDYRRDHGGTFYTVETHTRFLQEVAGGDHVVVRSRVLGADPKRVHVWHSMSRGDGEEAATMEAMLLHVAIADVEVTPMHDELLAAFTAMVELEVPAPTGTGRSIRGVV